MSYNKTLFEGHLGKEPEMRFTPDGKCVVKFSVGVNDGYGENKTTLWYGVTAWEKLAEICNEALHKGSHVFIEGRITEPGAWIGKEDSKAHASIEITANQVVFLDKKE
jgi:single-strand DNA-binding protein